MRLFSFEIEFYLFFFLKNRKASYIHLVSSQSPNHSEPPNSFFGNDPLHPYSSKKGYPMPKIASQNTESSQTISLQTKDESQDEEENQDENDDEEEEEGSEYDEEEIHTKNEKDEEERYQLNQAPQKVEVSIKEETHSVLVGDRISVQSNSISIVEENKIEESPPSILNQELRLPSNLADLILKKKSHLKPVMEKKLSLPKLGQSTDGLALILATALKNRRISSLEGSNSSLKESDSSSDDEWSD